MQRKIVLAISSFLVCGTALAAPTTPDPLLAPFQPLPKVAESTANPVTEAKVALGKRLYTDPQLSKSGTISCDSCHGLSTYGVDNEPTSPGHDGKRGDRNSPTSFNAALHV